MKKADWKFWSWEKYTSSKMITLRSKQSLWAGDDRRRSLHWISAGPMELSPTGHHWAWGFFNPPGRLPNALAYPHVSTLLKLCFVFRLAAPIPVIWYWTKCKFEDAVW